MKSDWILLDPNPITVCFTRRDNRHRHTQTGNRKQNWELFQLCEAGISRHNQSWEVLKVFPSESVVQTRLSGHIDVVF
jgi:hypothetical protein